MKAFQRIAASGWTVQPAAETLVRQTLETALSRVPAAREFAARLHATSGVRLRDIVDHFTFGDRAFGAALTANGWTADRTGAWRHAAGSFPDFVERAGPHTIAFRCESLEELQRATGAIAPIAGPRFGPFRRVDAFASDDTLFSAIERNGWPGYDPPDVSPTALRDARRALQVLRTRRRQFDRNEQGFAHLERLVNAIVGDLGTHWACDVFFRAEREYWMSRCSAGALQKRLQDAAGIGWSNVDHHTFDSSREWFVRAIGVLETLGFECRELFYAGTQAGWGSQILEQPVLRHTIFADIDLAPEELDIDFAHVPLPALQKHRRAGLWCAMHGESMLEAGLNHVAGLYDQAALRALLRNAGVRMMTPFSELPHLYQELTEGQWWPVDPARVDALERAGHLDANEAEDFRLNGAIGAHLENLERNDGYKGFNQPGIDGVLRVIDPRKNMVESG